MIMQKLRDIQIIDSPRQSGKSTRLVEAALEHVRDGGMAFIVHPSAMAVAFMKKYFPQTRHLRIRMMPARTIELHVCGVAADRLRWFWDDFNRCKDPFETPGGYYVGTSRDGQCDYPFPELKAMPSVVREIYATCPPSDSWRM